MKKKTRPDFLETSKQFIQKHHREFADGAAQKVLVLQAPWDISVDLAKLESMRPFWSVWLTVNIDREAASDFGSQLRRLLRQLVRIVRLRKAIETTKSKKKAARLREIEGWAGEYFIGSYLIFYQTIESIYSTFDWDFSTKKQSRFYMDQESIELAASFAKDCFETIASHLPNNSNCDMPLKAERLEDRWGDMVKVVSWFLKNSIEPGFFWGPARSKSDWLEMVDGIEFVRAFYSIPNANEDRIPLFDARGGDVLPVLDVERILPAWRSACRLLDQPMPCISKRESKEGETEKACGQEMTDDDYVKCRVELEKRLVDIFMEKHDKGMSTNRREIARHLGVPEDRIEAFVGRIKGLPAGKKGRPANSKNK